ncbi:hypothetical protein AMJ40_05945 [candidate division TA06 bacterium DG_26]|uniref:histidine kinase n=1 Tax=candidate division TA06 bacterium DG_26 TaxID=1703771 RepID=A0A0S7WGK2_UNCT6|nr:MAG: hypothetical protein AMJ40_05945 [candidate division TA06 bacterium DG_26]
MPGQRTILVIDDEEVIRESCRKVLSKEGYAVDAANDGPSGLRIVRDVRPDLALVDLKMPGMDGMEVLEKIKEIDESIVTVVITGYATIEAAVEAIKRGAYDFLPKPFTPDELRLIVKRGLEVRRLALESVALREEKEKMRRNFVTMVSHELKAPLAAVQQYFEVLLGGMAGEMSVEQKNIVQRVSERISGLLKLINDWLDMSRIEAGTLARKFESLEIVPILRRSMESVQPLAKKKNIRLSTAFGNALPEIQGDKETLEEVFTNLLMNGIQYNRENGTIEIEAGEENGYLVVRFTDTGIGISDEHRPLIFDEFFRVKTKDTEGISGTGLGLAIVKRIVEAHSGHVEVISELGKGSTFSVYLPRVRSDHR